MNIVISDGSLPTLNEGVNGCMHSFLSHTRIRTHTHTDLPSCITFHHNSTIHTEQKEKRRAKGHTHTRKHTRTHAHTHTRTHANTPSTLYRFSPLQSHPHLT